MKNKKANYDDILETYLKRHYELKDIAIEIRRRRKIPVSSYELEKRAIYLGLIDYLTVYTYKGRRLINLDKRDIAVLMALESGCRDSMEIGKQTGFNHVRLREISKRLKLGLDFSRHDNQVVLGEMIYGANQVKLARCY